jgi:hypothetical protein
MNAKLLMLTAVLFVYGCVNVHVHFPDAPADKPAASADKPAGATEGGTP